MTSEIDQAFKRSEKMQRLLKAITWMVAGNAAQKRRVRLELARMAAAFFGDFPLGDDNKLWLRDKDFRDQFQKLSPVSPYSMERKWTLREFVRSVANIPGAMAECGCYDGASAFFMAQANPDVPLHLFDSFEGLSEPQAEDIPQQKTERAWQKGDLSIPEQVARGRLRNFPNIHFHKGWIPDKFQNVANETFRLVHIDVDLYQPTKESLIFFYPRLSHSGVIILDDHGFTTCPGAFQATREFMEENKISQHLIMLSTGQGLLFKSFSQTR